MTRLPPDEATGGAPGADEQEALDRFVHAVLGRLGDSDGAEAAVRSLARLVIALAHRVSPAELDRVARDWSETISKDDCS
ncbi:hypothetical protein [Thermaurantiacus sp.]